MALAAPKQVGGMPQGFWLDEQGSSIAGSATAPALGFAGNWRSEQQA